MAENAKPKHDDRSTQQRYRQCCVPVWQTKQHMPRLDQGRRTDPEHHGEIPKINHLCDKRTHITAAYPEKRAARNSGIRAGLGTHDGHERHGERADERADNDGGERAPPIQPECHRQCADDERAISHLRAEKHEPHFLGLGVPFRLRDELDPTSLNVTWGINRPGRYVICHCQLPCGQDWPAPSYSPL